MPQVALQVLCVAPFLRVPTVQLGYGVLGQTLSQSLNLPLSVGKFCTPPGAPVPRDAFFGRWRAIPGARFCLISRVAVYLVQLALVPPSS